MNSKWYSKGRLGRISIAWLLSVMMMVTFVPTFAFANPTDDEGGAQVEQDADVQDEQAAESAPAEEDDPVVNAKGGDDGDDEEIDDEEGGGDEEEIMLGEITFSEGADLDWSWAFPVAGKNTALAVENMGIIVKDENDTPVDSDNYELSFEKTWWDDGEEDDLYEPASSLTPGEDGFTKYIVTAEAIEGSGYIDCVNEDFYVMDQYCLNWICCDEDFAPLRQMEDLGMYHNWRGGVTSLPDSPVVRNSAKGDALTLNDDYTVEYYVRVDEIGDDGEPEIGLGERVTGKPTDMGGYIARIKGNGDYYGTSDIAIDLTEYDDIWFDETEEGALWSDNTKEYKITAPAIEGGTFELTVGIQENDEEEQSFWALTFDEADEDYTYNSETGTLLLNGPKICEKLEEEDQAVDDCNITIYACIKVGDEIQSEGLETVWLHESIVDDEMDKDWQINGNRILPGWDGWIKREYNYYCENAENPDGKRLVSKITNAEVIEGKDVLEIELQGADNENGGGDFARYESRKIGEATVKLTFTRGDEEGLERTFKVYVVPEVYRANMWSRDGLYQGLPGDEIALSASGNKDVVFYDEEDPDNPHYDSKDGDLFYHWKITEGKEYATITWDEKDPSQAVLTFKTIDKMPADWNGSREDVHVEMWISDDEAENPNEELASADNWFAVGNEYWQIEPTQTNANLPIDATETIEPKVYHHKLVDGEDQKTDVTGDASFNWEEVDDQCVDIQAGETEDGAWDGTYTIRRNGDWDTNFCLTAEYAGDDEEIWWETEQWYHLNHMEQRMWFDSGSEFENEEDVVYDDGDFTYTLMTEGLPEEAEFTYTVIRGNGDPLPEGCCDIAEDDEGNLTFTLHGAVLAAPENNIRWVKLRAEASVGDDVICRTYDEEDEYDWTICTVVESFVNHHFGDTEMLPGWDYWIDGYNDMYVENTVHPFGENVDYEVTGVEVTAGAALIGEGLDDDGKSLIRQVDEENEDYFEYFFRIKEADEIEQDLPADVKLKISYVTIGDEDDEGFEPEEGSFNVTVTVAETVYRANMWSVSDIYQGLPGDEIELKAQASKESLADDGSNEETSEGLVYHWEIEDGEEFATIEADSEDPSAAVLKFNDPMPEGWDENNEGGQRVLVKMFVTEADDEEDVECASANNDFWVSNEFWQIEPTGAELGLADLDLGESESIEPTVYHYKYGQQKAPVSGDVAFEWEYNENVVTVTPVESNPGEYTITRHGTDDCDVRLMASWNDGGNREADRHYWIDRIESGLWDYDIKVKNSADGYRLYGAFGDGDSVDAADVIELVHDGYTLDPQYYELAIWYEQWTDDDEQNMIEIEDGKLTYHGEDNSSYQIQATATDGSPFEGETDKRWIELHNDKSLAGADISFPEKSAGFQLSPMVDYYWFTAGETLDPVVTINGGGPLTAGVDYTVSYIDENGEASASFPTTPGKYTCQISPAEGSQYSDGYDRTILMILTEEDMAAAEAAIKEGQPVFKKIEKLFDEDCSEEYKQSVRAEYDALSDEAKAWTPAQLKNILHEETGCFWETKTVPAGMYKHGRTYEECSECHSVRKEVAIVEGTAPSFVKKMKVKKGKGNITVKWKKQSKKNLKKFKGYEIRYSTNANMSGAKTVKAGKKAKTKKIKKLKKKTVYYVQMRSYSVVKGKTYYSNWTTKKVKTK